MTELIDKNWFIKEIEAIKFSEDAKKMNVTYDANMDGFFKGLVEGMVGFMPTTTEAEIRASAIDEFAEKLKWEIKNSIGISKRVADFTRAVIGMVAEQLKEE